MYSGGQLGVGSVVGERQIAARSGVGCGRKADRS